MKNLFKCLMMCMFIASCCVSCGSDDPVDDPIDDPYTGNGHFDSNGKGKTGLTAHIWVNIITNDTVDIHWYKDGYYNRNCYYTFNHPNENVHTLATNKIYPDREVIVQGRKREVWRFEEIMNGSIVQSIWYHPEDNTISTSFYQGRLETNWRIIK